MKHLVYKGAGLALAGSMLFTAAPLYAQSQQVVFNLQQKNGQGRSYLDIELQGLGQEVIALELGIIADDIKEVQKVLWDLSGEAHETYQLITLEDGKEKLVFYLVAKDKNIPFKINSSMKMQLIVSSDKNLIFDEEAFYIKVIEKGYETHLYENLKVNYSEGVFVPEAPEQPSEPEVPEIPQKPEQKPEEDSSGGNGNSGDSSDTDSDDDDTVSEGGGTGSNGNNSDAGSSNDAALDENSQMPEREETVSFTDIKSHWAASAIMEMADKGIIKGYEDGSFKPGATVTRGEFATLLARAFNLKSTGSQNPFKDVQADKWYTEGVAALYEAGITSGRADGTFGVNSPITNEEISTMIYRTLNVLNMELADLHSQSVSFNDAQQISTYAREAVEALYQKGIIHGNADGSFAPKAATTRAQVAVMLSRIFNLIK